MDNRMIKNGIDRIDEYSSLFQGKRLGLITTPTGLSASGKTTIDILHKKYGLSALFAPEHGVRGSCEAGALVDTYKDEETGITVYSLYRKDSKRLTEEMLSQVDAVVYDIQDVGARFYTFIYTMLYALEDCAKAGKPFIILDRPNPLGGKTVEGNILREKCKSFVGAYPLCMRYGLTVGEFAVMANNEEKLGCDLHVIPCEGWARGMQFPDYGTVWVPPSPNIPHFVSALIYSGICLLEATNISEGRGTATPFETIGAPFINAQRLADEMNGRNLPGVWFRPAYFTPAMSKHQGKQCAGIQIHITDRRAVRPVDIGVNLVCLLRREYEEFKFVKSQDGDTFKIDSLSGDTIFRGSNLTAKEILEEYHKESSEFIERTKPYQLYGE